MIGEAAASAAAAAALASLARQHDPMLLPWGEVTTGAPLPVHTPGGAHAYWLVPLTSRGRAIGFVRVDAAARVAAIGITCRTPDRIDACPAHVTGLSAEEAAARAGLRPGETASPARLVHDGPPGREAWLVETWRGGAPARWVFVTAGGCHDRPAGTPHVSAPSCE